MYIGTRHKVIYKNREEGKLREMYFDCTNDGDLVDEVESKGYFYLGTDDLGEMAFLKACDDYDEFMSCRRVQ